MNRLAALLLFVIALAACSAADDPPGADTAPPSIDGSIDASADGSVDASAGSTAPPDGSEDEAVRSAMMAAAVENLISQDHTFGQGPPPFTEYLVQERLDPAAGSGFGTGEETRALTDDERAAISEVVATFGPLRWIDAPEDWRTPDLNPTIEGAAILGVGEPIVEGETGTVPVSLWCGGTCGTWLTYQLDLVGGTWQVTGTEGPVAIS
jgi:hypothetical protein